METVLSILVGLGLAAACGFRVFVPVLVLAIGARCGAVQLGENSAWLGETPALVALSLASCLEVLGYWIPWVDHLLDTIASPAAVVAGTLVAASQMGELNPMLQWSAALIAGGGLAGLVQTATVTTRAASTTLTGGIANPLFSTGETALAGVLSVGSIVVPGLVVLFIVIVLIATTRVVVGARRVAA